MHPHSQVAHTVADHQQYQQKHGGSLASRTPREEASLRPIDAHAFGPGGKFSHENVDFKNVQSFQAHANGMTQGLGLMNTQNTNSQPNLQQYNLINSIQQQQLIHNQIVTQPQDLPGAQG